MAKLQELLRSEQVCELFPETVNPKIRKLYEHADAKRKEREALTTGPLLGK
jgi:hypothetical protein